MANLYLRRRELLNGHEYDIGTLKYWWSSEDAPVSGKWVDRISGLKPSSHNDPYDPENGYYECNDSNYLSFNMNTGNFSLGNHWRIALDADIKANTSSSNATALIDFGSVASASKAFGITLNANTSRAHVNWKMQGNNSSPGVGVGVSSTYLPKDSNYHRLRMYYEIVDGSDGYDRFNCCINGSVYHCTVQIQKVVYGPTFEKAACFFGRGYTSGYAGTVRFYDIRMYQID